MKILTGTIVLLASSLAFAAPCPDLAGTYSCNYDGTPETVMITQAVDAAGVTAYTVNGDELVADGVERIYQDDEGTKLTIAASCESDKLIVLAEETAADGSYTINGINSITKTSAGLQQDMTGTYTAGNRTQDFSSSVTCELK